MKKLITIAAIVATLGTSAVAGTSRIERTNVALANGVFADGFKLFGYGITSFVEHQYANEEFMGDNVVIMPEGVSAEDLEEVEAYLTSIGITGYDVVCHDRGGDKTIKSSGGNHFTSASDFINSIQNSVNSAHTNGPVGDGPKVNKTSNRCKW